MVDRQPGHNYRNSNSVVAQLSGSGDYAQMILVRPELIGDQGELLRQVEFGSAGFRIFSQGLKSDERWKRQHARFPFTLRSDRKEVFARRVAGQHDQSCSLSQSSDRSISFLQFRLTKKFRQVNVLQIRNPTD